MPDETAKQRGESTLGRLHDLFTVLRASIAGVGDTDTIYFSVIFTVHGNPKKMKMKATVSPGDDPRPVITVMLPDED